MSPETKATRALLVKKVFPDQPDSPVQPDTGLREGAVIQDLLEGLKVRQATQETGAHRVPLAMDRKDPKGRLATRFLEEAVPQASRVDPVA